MGTKEIIDALMPQAIAMMFGLTQPPVRVVRARRRKKRDRRNTIAKASRKRNR